MPCACCGGAPGSMAFAHRPAHTTQTGEGCQQTGGALGLRGASGPVQSERRLMARLMARCMHGSKGVEGASEDIKVIWSRLVKASACLLAALAADQPPWRWLV